MSNNKLEPNNKVVIAETIQLRDNLIGRGEIKDNKESEINTIADAIAFFTDELVDSCIYDDKKRMDTNLRFLKRNFKVLKDNKFSINTTGLLRHAVEHGKEDLIDFLLSDEIKANPRHPLKNGEEPIFMCVNTKVKHRAKTENCTLRILKKLIDTKSHAWIKNSQGQNAVAVYAKTANPKVLKFFIDKGVNVNEKDVLEKTALMYSHPANIQTLVERGARIHELDEDKNNALILQAAHGGQQGVGALLNAKADATLQNSFNENALSVANERLATEKKMRHDTSVTVKIIKKINTNLEKTPEGRALKEAETQKEFNKQSTNFKEQISDIVLEMNEVIENNKTKTHHNSKKEAIKNFALTLGESIHDKNEIAALNGLDFYIKNRNKFKANGTPMRLLHKQIPGLKNSFIEIAAYKNLPKAVELLIKEDDSIQNKARALAIAHERKLPKIFKKIDTHLMIKTIEQNNQKRLFII